MATGKKGISNACLVILGVLFFICFCSGLGNLISGSRGSESISSSTTPRTYPANTPTRMPSPISTTKPTPIRVTEVAPTRPAFVTGSVNAQAANLRSGPGTDYQVVGRAEYGDVVTVYAKTEDGFWLQVDEAGNAWIAASLVDIPSLSQVPVARAIPPTPKPEAPTPTPQPSPVPTPEPTMTQAPAQEVALVSFVVDGDTIDVVMNGQVYRVRYIGINAPEPDQPGGVEAAEANRALVEGKTVTMVKDVSEVDKYGRLLRYVYVGGLFVNAELVRKGWAQASTYPPDVAHAEEFAALEGQARAAGVGLWAAPTPAPTAPPDRAGNCDPSYPDVCIPPPPPDLDCPDIPYRRFRVLPPDPHRFDRDHDGIGCESR